MAYFKTILACFLSLTFCGQAMSAGPSISMKNARAIEIVKASESKSAALDATYDFASLAQIGLLPPVLKPGANSPSSHPCSVEACLIAKPARPYCKASTASAPCDPMTWRDYLYKGLETARSNDEADAQFRKNLEELTDDYKGMLLYSALAAQGLVKMNTPSTTTR